MLIKDKTDQGHANYRPDAQGASRDQSSMFDRNPLSAYENRESSESFRSIESVIRVDSRSFAGNIIDRASISVGKISKHRGRREGIEHPDKTFIGKTGRGISFLGYEFNAVGRLRRRLLRDFGGEILGDRQPFLGLSLIGTFDHVSKRWPVPRRLPPDGSPTAGNPTAGNFKTR